MASDNGRAQRVGMPASRRRYLKRRGAWKLFPFHGFVDRDLATFFYGDHFVDAFESRQGDINNVVAWSDHKFGRRELLEDTAVHGDLRTFRLCANAHRSHPHSVVAAASKQFFEFADIAKVVDIAQGAQGWRELEILSGAEICTCCFVKIPLFVKGDGVWSFVD